MTYYAAKGFFWNILRIYFLIAALYGLYAWPFWSMPELLMPCVFFVMTAVFLIAGGGTVFRPGRWSILIMLLIAYLTGTSGNFNGFVFGILCMLPFMLFLWLRDDLKPKMYCFLRTSLALIMGVSVIAFIAHLCGVRMPYELLDYGWSDRRDAAQYIFANYYLFLVNLRLDDLILIRFSCIFLEPGYVGCLSAVFLYLDRFNMRRWTSWAFLISLAMTFSVAGYAVFFAGLILYRISFSRRKVQTIMGLVVGIAAFYLFFTYYNDGDNVVNQRIFDRMRIDESGHMAGNNRTTDSFNVWFEQRFLKSDDIILGTPSTYIRLFSDTPNVGWKFYMANFGIVGLFTYLLYLFSVVWPKRNYFTLTLFVLYLMIFWRGHFFNFSPIFLILYIVGIYNFNNISGHDKQTYRKSNRILSPPVSSNS